MSYTNRRPTRARRGFGLLETLVAISILTIGLTGLAYLMATLMRTSHTSRYMSTATVLGSEKLEDLNRLAPSHTWVWAPDGGTSGSLTADLTQFVSGQQVDYYDRILVAATNGSFVETVINNDAAGNPQYTTVTHNADGTAVSAVSLVPPPTSSDTVTFNRRWVIEKDPPGLPVGVRRITVWVSAESSGIKMPPYQASLVRP